MSSISELPCRVREIEHLEIQMSDGCCLAARIWMPDSAEREPVPAILEYIPYRKNDLYAWRDALKCPYVAARGYACVRIDLRGAGESQGVLTDEYLQRELDDGREAIAWIARQPWCDGSVGMIGISWGGFNSLQIAALRPAALKAIITVASTDDRYADDVHYMGGCLLSDNLSWASVMFGRNTCPPDPRLVGAAWRDTWLARLKGSGLWLETWLSHQVRDSYWRHGSVCEDFSQIACPVYAVGGWADGYVNAVFRLLRGLRVPRKGLVGPWGHNNPHTAMPGPKIGFLQECIRWWDYWLKGRANGIMEEPMLRAWMQEPVAPQSSYETRPGRWICESEWPSSNVRIQEMRLCGDRRLAPTSDGPPATFCVNSPLSTGIHGAKWLSYGAPGDQAVDQRPDDSTSLTFETDPLPEAVEVLGEIVLEIGIASDQPVAMLAARVNSVAPDGASTRVTFGLMNLTHRDSQEHPTPLLPGVRHTMRLGFRHVGQRFEAGHRLRLALSTSYWPMAWLPPGRVTLTVHTAGSRLLLPVRRPRPEDDRLVPFPDVETAAPQRIEQLRPPAPAWRVTHDLAGDNYLVEITGGIGAVRYPDIDLEVSTDGLEQYRVTGSDPGSQRGEVCWTIRFSRGDWEVKTVTRTTLTCDSRTFFIDAELRAYHNGKVFHEQSWRRAIARYLV
jgi:putative CocE/NonD family hydrolase